MKVRDLQCSLEQHAKATLVSIADIVSWSGRSRDYIRLQILRGLPYVKTGKQKLYFSGDVAKAIADKSVITDN